MGSSTLTPERAVAVGFFTLSRSWSKLIKRMTIMQETAMETSFICERKLWSTLLMSMPLRKTLSSQFSQLWKSQHRNKPVLILLLVSYLH